MISSTSSIPRSLRRAVGWLLLSLSIVTSISSPWQKWTREKEEMANAAAIEAARRNSLLLERYFDTPQSLFNAYLASLIAIIVMIKLFSRRIGGTSTIKTQKDEKPDWAISIQKRFLPVFWLVRTAFWMSGPYFYAVYSSKIVDGVPASASLVSQIFLAGFASIAIFGPLTGRAFDAYGRKKGTIAAALVYSLGAISTQSSIVSILFIGRALGGVGTSMLANAPESWLVAAFQSEGDNGKWLSDTFGLAFSGDYITAIIAGQIAGIAATQRGPTGPCQLSPIFLGVGALVAALFWDENKAEVDPTSTTGRRLSARRYPPGSFSAALKVMVKDPKIMIVGGVQGLFEASMYVFVMQWPPALNEAVKNCYGESASTPYGTVFSCFMACCLLGSAALGLLAKTRVTKLDSTTVLLAVSALSLGYAAYSVSGPPSLSGLTLAFFMFEACVGMYFPSIGSLRSQFLPDSHRALIMTLFGVPLNIMVVAIFVFIHKLGSRGALGVSSAALTISVLYMFKLRQIVRAERRIKAKKSWKILADQVKTGMVFQNAQCDMANYNRGGIF